MRRYYYYFYYFLNKKKQKKDRIHAFTANKRISSQEN